MEKIEVCPQCGGAGQGHNPKTNRTEVCYVCKGTGELKI